MRHAIYISLLTSVTAIVIMFNSCSSFEIPVQLNHQGIFIPSDSGIPVNSSGLTQISTVDPTIVIDLKYKTSDNFTQQPLYKSSMTALVRPKTATRLWYANKMLKEHGFRLKIWDAYRPQSAQIALWEASGENPKYVADPYKKPSLHTHGVAVDVTLVNLDGSPVPMPTKFDDFSEKASPQFFHTNPVVRRNLRILRTAMRSAGFQHIKSEWWHFLDQEYQKYDIIPSLD